MYQREILLERNAFVGSNCEVGSTVKFQVGGRSEGYGRKLRCELRLWYAKSAGAWCEGGRISSSIQKRPHVRQTFQ